MRGYYADSSSGFALFMPAKILLHKAGAWGHEREWRLTCSCNSADFNKRVIGKLYQELREQADMSLMNESMSLNGSILVYMDKLLGQVPYALEYKMDFDILGLLKLYGVKVDNSAEDLLEKIVEYLRVMRQICGVTNFVFVGLKHYLLEEELKQLYEFVFYEKINLIIFEAIHFSHIYGEKCWIFDKDMCIIEV